MLKTPHVRITFRSCDVEKVHAVVARSTSADFLNFGAADFPFQDPFVKCFKIVFFFFGVE